MWLDDRWKETDVALKCRGAILIIDRLSSDLVPGAGVSRWMLNCHAEMSDGRRRLSIRKQRIYQASEGIDICRGDDPGGY